MTSVSSKSREAEEKDRDCRNKVTRPQATGSQQGHRADTIDNMGNVIAFSLHFFIWEERVREIEKSEGVCKGSCCILLQSAVVISGAATAILSYLCLAATPQPIDGSLGRPSPALSPLPLESGRLSGSYPKMGH